MVSSEDVQTVRITNFEQQKKRRRLYLQLNTTEGKNRVEASVNIIAHKEIVGVGNVTTNFEQLDKVVKLAMDIAAYRNGTGNWLNVRFIHEYFACLFSHKFVLQPTLSQIVFTSDSGSSLHSETQSIHSSTFSIDTFTLSFILRPVDPKRIE